MNKVKELDRKELLRYINATMGEGEQQDLIIELLDNLLGWYAICFNNEKEEKEYKILSNCLLKMIAINETYGYKYEKLKEYYKESEEK